MDKILNYAVVGLGVGKSHCRGAAQAEGARLYAVCDLVDELLQKVHNEYPDVKLYSDYDEMLADPEIDIVSVCVPSGMHADLAIKALRAGKHVLVEKPMTIYPFAIDPRQAGTRGQKKQFNRAKVVCISNAFNLKVYWGTKIPFTMIDSATQKGYTVGASGVFYIEIEPSDGGRNADRFYRKMLTQGDPSQMTTEMLRDRLAEAFLNRVGAKIQEYLEALNRPLSNMVGLQPSEFLKISEELYPKLKDIFEDYGLTIAPSSTGSILGRLIVNPLEG